MTRVLRRPYTPLLAAVAALAAVIGGCATRPRIPHTAAEQASAEVEGFGDIRRFADAPSLDSWRDRPVVEARREIVYLALSGGGADGAFGAGALVGWTARGTRPAFTIVSGVSTGALIAPFAFLGPRYDGAMREVYTGGHVADLVTPDALIDTFLGIPTTSRRLRSLMDRYVTEAMLDEIAAEHGRGRYLLVMTTNLDAQRPVLWDMGRIAASRRPDRVALFKDVLTASASIPMVFSPVLIDVASGGREFAEMHVDGGVTKQVFVVPDAMRRERLTPAQRQRVRLYVIVNGRLEPSFRVVGDGALPIAARAISTMTKTSVRDTVDAARDFARTNRLPLSVASINPTIPEEPTPTFDTAYMRRLFDHGFERALAGRLWDVGLPARRRPDDKVAAAGD